MFKIKSYCVWKAEWQRKRESSIHWLTSLKGHKKQEPENVSRSPKEVTKTQVLELLSSRDLSRELNGKPHNWDLNWYFSRGHGCAKGHLDDYATMLAPWVLYNGEIKYTQGSELVWWQDDGYGYGVDFVLVCLGYWKASWWGRCP